MPSDTTTRERRAGDDGGVQGVRVVHGGPPMIDYPDSIAGRLRLASELLAHGLAVTRWRTLPWWRRLRTAPPALPDWSAALRWARDKGERP